MTRLILHFIGAYTLEVMLVLFLGLLLALFGLWHLFEGVYPGLWAMASRLWERVAQVSFIRHLRRRYPALWTFLGNRLSPDGYLGLHLTVGLILTLVAVSLFANTAGAVLEQEALVQFDLGLAQALHQNATAGQVTLFRLITHLGDTPALTGLGIIMGLVLLLRRRWLLLAGWITTLVGGGLLNLLLKSIFQRPRPEFANPFVVESFWSFPSGHAMGSFIVYGMLAYLLLLSLKGPWRRVVLGGAVLLVLLIGFSRLYLGVHFLSDVAAGYMAGAVWLTVAISGMEVARRRKMAPEDRSQTSPIRMPPLPSAPAPEDPS